MKMPWELCEAGLEHEFVPTGRQFVEWVSDTVVSRPPEDAPRMNQVKCSRCGVVGVRLPVNGSVTLT